MSHTQTIILSFLLALLASLFALLGTHMISPAFSMPPAFPVNQAPQVIVQPGLGVANINKPLVLIRFNQRKVFFQQQLKTAVMRAMDVRPNVMFSMVSYVPITGDTLVDQRKIATAAANTRDVTKSLIEMGVPPQQIHSTTEFANRHDGYDEIHIFVR